MPFEADGSQPALTPLLLTLQWCFQSRFGPPKEPGPSILSFLASARNATSLIVFFPWLLPHIAWLPLASLHDIVIASS